MKMKYASKDFEELALPKTRFKQFGSILKLEWRTLLKIGLLLLVFFLIFFALEIGKWAINNAYYRALQEAGKLEDYEAARKMVHFFYSIILIIPFTLIAVGLSGLIRVIQHLVYGDGVLFKEDFLTGVKLNVKQYLFITIFFWVIHFIVQVNITFVSGIDILSQIVQGVSIGIEYALVVPIVLFFIAGGSTYKLKFKENLSNSSKLVFASLIIVILFSFSIYGLTYLNMISNIAIRVLVQALVVLIVGPIYLLAWYTYAFSRFDKYINLENYPEFYRKGLRKLHD